MKSRLFAMVAVVVSCPLVYAGEAPPSLCEPWRSPYAGQDATGETVIALWHFDAGAETKDASGHGHDAALQDAKVAPEGRFGAALESFPGYPIEDKQHRAFVKNHADLSPQGAFTIEMWIRPKAELDAKYPVAFLLDKKYVANTDYQLTLDDADRYGSRVLSANLGFGSRSVAFHARPFRYEPGVWRHIAFTYDGAGTGCFFIDGLPAGTQHEEGIKSIVPGDHGLAIGDRIGSLFHGFPGTIDEVRITRGAREFRAARFERLDDRTCFVRMESPVTLHFAVTNLLPTTMAQGTVTLELDDVAKQEKSFSDLASGKSAAMEFPLDTTLRPDSYRLVARLAVPGPEPFASEETFAVRIVPRRPERFPVLMWGIYGGVMNEMDRLERIGFSHVLGLGADDGKIWEAGEPTEAAKPEQVATTGRMLDEALARDMTVVASLSPCRDKRTTDAFLRVDREGKHYEGEDICGLFPELQRFSYNVGASMARTYGHYPAFGAALLHTEVRDSAELCFHQHDLDAFRKFAGFDIPAAVNRKRGIDYHKLPDFPASRVIPDDHPIYVYYKWFWKEGDGWNAINSELARGLKSTGRKDLWTFHDPAVRVASVYGSGGEADVVSQWTYSYPDPIRIAVATDELLAMAGGAAHPQQVMKMTQIIWYRSQTAPEPKTPAEALPYRARWEREQPDAPFITIAPAHLREAFWTKIARPIKGIMYHGWQSLVPCGGGASYRYTNPETQDELTRLIHEVVRPLGPTLLATPGVKSDVAFLESFASQMFAGRGTYGWCGGWEGDAYHVMLYAHLQPEIVYDETVAERGLDGFRVLVMPNCDVITQKMADAIGKFQAGGGLVVGDQFTAPAIKPDVVLDSYRRTGRADQDKAALQAVAAKLREQLDSRYSRYADSSNPDVIPYRRRFAETDYLFLVNDHREYGRYVGHHGRVMDSGLPSRAEISLGRGDGFVYDLVEHCEVAAEKKGDRLVLDVQLGPCDGALYVVSPRRIDRVGVQAADSVAPGERLECVVSVLDPDGKPLDAVVPLEVTIRDADGHQAEFSGYYAAVGGKLALPLDIAKNDPPGVWEIRVRELASGRVATAYVRVVGPKPWPPAPGPVDKDAANPVQPKG